MSFFDRLFHRAPKVDAETLLWLELSTPEDVEPIDKKILNALAGKGEPLSAEADVAEFLSYDWQRIKNTVYEFAIGEKVCLMPYFQRILATYPNSAKSLFNLCIEQMAAEPRLIFLAYCGESPESLAAAAEKRLPTSDVEERTLIMRLLGEHPSEKGCALLVAALADEDWRIAMKAAAALGETGDARYAEAVFAAALNREAAVAKGMTAIAEKLKGENLHA